MAAVWALSVLSTKVRGYPLRGVLESIARMRARRGARRRGDVAGRRNVGGNTGADALVRLLAGTATTVAVYAVVLFVLAAPELKSLRRFATGRVGATAPAS